MSEEPMNLKERIQKFVKKKFFFLIYFDFFYRYQQCGFVSGFVMSFVAIISYLIFLFLDYNQPRRLIDLSIDYSKEEFEKKM